MTFIHNCIDALFKRNLRHQHSMLTRSQWLQPAQILEIQQKKLVKLLRHAQLNVPYYNTVLSGWDGSIESFTKVPLLTRNLIINNFEQLKATNINSAKRHTQRTGGSTGQPMTMYLDNKLYDVCRAVELRGDYDWTGQNKHARKVILWGQPRENAKTGIRKTLGFALNGTLKQRWKYYISSASESDLNSYVKQISSLQPEILFGYVSSLKRVGDYIRHNNICNIRPQIVLVTAETLTEQIKEELEKTYHAPVYNRYAASEFGLIASECPQRSLHIHSERLLLEVVRNGQPVPPGVEGEIVITDLDNYAFPLIRYSVGDVGILSEDPCPCGRGLPVLKCLLGRTVDYIKLPPPESPVLAMNLMRCIRLVNTYNQIQQMQIIQKALDVLVFRIIRRKNFTEDTGTNLRNLVMERYFHSIPMKIKLEYVDYIEPAPSGKFKFFISELPSE